MAKRGRPRKNAKPEEKDNPHGTIVLEQLEEGAPVTANWSTGTGHEEEASYNQSFTEDPNDKSQPVNIATSDDKIDPFNSEKYSRDKNGLLRSIDYKFNEDGSVNWRAMVDPKYLFPNRSWFEARDKQIPTSVEGLQDNQLLIKLAGIKELAKLRGYNSVRYNVIKCEKDHVAVKCEISWIPNFENPAQESDFLPPSTHFEDVANATTENTSSFATKFLETIAANRSFVRCVRNFLNVHIVGDDEIDKSSNGQHAEIEEAGESDPMKDLTPNGVLESLVLSELKCNTFDDFKAKLREMWQLKVYQNKDAANWGSYGDIPAKEARVLIRVIKSG